MHQAGRTAGVSCCGTPVARLEITSGQAGDSPPHAYIILILLAACALDPRASGSREPVKLLRQRTLTRVSDVWGDYGLDLSTGNPDIHADNFFMHVNGGWYDAFEILADRARYGSFDLLAGRADSGCAG